MAPMEYGYFASGAIGNQATETCDAQGFLSLFGGSIGLFYNSSICIYYIVIVTFNKDDNYIWTKLEPWLHGISIMFNLALFSAILAINGYNSIAEGGGSCGFDPNSHLPHWAWEWRGTRWFHHSVWSWGWQGTSYIVLFFVHFWNLWYSSRTSRNCSDHGTYVRVLYARPRRKCRNMASELFALGRMLLLTTTLKNTNENATSH